MYRPLATLFPLALVLLMLPITASGGAGHAGPTPTEEVMFVHFTDNGLALNQATPTNYALSEAASDAPSCGTTLSWQAGFANNPGAGPTELVRDAVFDAPRPTLTWYLQALVPGTTTASPLPMQDITLQASIRSGSDLQTLGDGASIAEVAETITPSATALPGVYAIETKLPWTNEPIIPGNDSMQLEIVMQFGPDACGTNLPGIRAYADETMKPRIRWFIFDPIRIDAFEGEASNGTATLRLEASGPWGTGNFAPLEAPILKGGTGPVSGVTLESSQSDGVLVARWTWQQDGAPNGTYSAEITVRDLASEASASDKVIFKVGGDHPVPVLAAAETPTKETPAPTVAGLVIAVAGAAVMKNRRRS